MIKPTGPFDAEIVVLGECPDREDYNAKTPFAGSAGRLLFDKWLAQAGIRQDKCLQLYAHWSIPPPPHKFDALSSEMKDRDKEKTLDVIHEHPRKLVIAVGSGALRLLTGETEIVKWRGSIIPGDGNVQKIIPLIPPNSVIRSSGYNESATKTSSRKNMHYRSLCEHDAKRCADVVENPNLGPPTREIMHAGNSTPHEILAKLESYKEVLSPIAFDIETFRHTITCLGLAKSDTDAVVVPLTSSMGWTYSIQAAALEIIYDILTGPAPKIGQNLDYDVQYLAKCLNIPVNSIWIDTAIAHSCLHPELPHDLGFLASIYTLEPYFKEMHHNADASDYDTLHWRYNGLDCCVTWEIGMKLEYELKNTSSYMKGITVHQLFHDRVLPAQKTLIRMQNRGVLVDANIREERHKELSADLEKLEKDPVLNEVNPYSPKQVKEQLHAWGVTKAKSTDELTLKKIRGRRQDMAKFIDTVLACRGKRKLKSTYIEAETHSDGRMRCAYRLFVTETGRARSGSDVFNLGTNLQNIPGGQRDWICADPGLVFWEADGNQIEARITAWLSQDEEYIRAFLDGEDVHAQHASSLFRIPETQVKELIQGTTKSYRDAGKRVTHAWSYWIGAGSLQEHINDAVPGMPFTLSEAKNFLATLDRIRPGVAAWRLKVVEELTRSRTVYTPFGRQRTFLGPNRKDRFPNDLHREAVAHKPQSIAADHMHGALVRTEQRLEDVPRADLLLYTHDAIAGQCLPKDLERVKQIVCEEISRPLPIVWNEIPCSIPADFGSGSNWKESHP